MKTKIFFLVFGVIIGIVGLWIADFIVREKLFPDVKRTLAKDVTIKDDSGWGENAVGTLKKGTEVTQTMQKGGISYVKINFILPSDSFE